MSQLIHIFQYKLISFIKVSTEFRVSSMLKTAGSMIVYFAFGIGVYFLTKSSLVYLLEEIKIGSFLLHRFMSIILFIFFMAVNAGNILVSFSTLYRSKEVYYLMTKPISFTKIFIIKFLDNFFYSSTTLLLMISTVMLAYCVYFKINFAFIAFFFFAMLLPFMLSAASLGVILLMILIRISFRIGVRKVVAGLIISYLLAFIFYFQASNPISIVKKVMAYYPNVNSYFGSLDSPIIKFLPNFWIADSLYWFSHGSLWTAFPFVALLICTSLTFLCAAIFIANKMYYKTWLESYELKSKKTDKRFSRKKFKIFSAPTFVNPQVDVLVKKEFLQFFREPSQWIHFSMMIFLISIFVFSLADIKSSLINAYNFGLQAIIYLTIFSFNLFLISSLSLRFVFPAVSLENDAYWKVKSSPITVKKILAVKFSILFSLIFLIGQGLNYFSHKYFPQTLFLISSINTGFITLAIVSLNFAMGTLFINLKEKSPIRIASSQGASLTFLFTLVLIAFLIAVLFIPIYNYYNDILGYQERLKNIYLTSLLIGALSLLISAASMVFTKKALLRDL